MSEGDSPRESGRPRRPKRTRDRVLGVLLGIVIGIAVIIAFTFYGSEETIDNPGLEREGQQSREAPLPSPPEQPPPPRQTPIPSPAP